MELTREQQLFQSVIEKAWEDAAFKQELIANPVKTIENFTGAKLNVEEGKTLVVRDQSDNSTVYINIPAKTQTEDVELNEEQLEAVAGGTSIDPILTILPWPPKGCFPTFPDDYITM